jgi:hypothetical protein
MRMLGDVREESRRNRRPRPDIEPQRQKGHQADSVDLRPHPLGVLVVKPYVGFREAERRIEQSETRNQNAEVHDRCKERRARDEEGR